MKPFELDAVLKYRKRLLDIAKNKYNEAQKQYNTVRKQYDQKSQEHSSLIESLYVLQNQGMEVQEYIRYERRIELLKSEVARLNERLKKKQEMVVRERNHLLQKSKEHQVMEKLKEKQNAAWRQHLNKKETAMLDEIGVMFKNR